MSTHECPTCGRADFASERGVKLHHVYQHGESLAGVRVECAWCGVTFRRPAVQVERRENVFCSTDCMGQWQSQARRGEDHPNYNRVQVECEECGDAFMVYKTREGEVSYCSRECMTHQEPASE